MSESLAKWKRSALTRVPRLRESSVEPAPAWTIMPAGLLMTARCLSSWRMSRGMSSGKAWSGVGLRSAFDLDGLAAVEFLFRLGGVAVDADLAGLDEELDAGAADVGDGLGEVLVEAKVGGGWVGGEGADAGGVRRRSPLRGLRSRGLGTGGGWISSTPRVATYSGRTVRRRWPLGSMFLDGMGDQLSGLEEENDAGE